MSVDSNRDSLLKLIKYGKFLSPGNANFVNSPGTLPRLYHSLPSDPINIISHRGIDIRFDLMNKHLDFSGKTVLDIGCNVGKFCFLANKAGAKCIGIDIDADSINVANAYKKSNKLNNINFHNLSFDKQSIDFLIQTYGQFDVILILSVNHWLLYQYGDREYIWNLLNCLTGNKLQTIVYEPSTSSHACFPEEVKTQNIVEFFQKLGCFSYQKIGSTYAQNNKHFRQLWIGSRDLAPLYKNLDKNIFSYSGSPVKIIKKSDKTEIFRWKYLLIERSNSKKPGFVLFENKVKVSSSLINDPANNFLPILINNFRTTNNHYLVKEFISWPRLDHLDKSISYLDIRRNLYHILNRLGTLNLVHNDIIPRNIFVETRTGRVKIVDFEYCLPQGSNPIIEYNLTTRSQKDYLSLKLEKVGSVYRNKHIPLFSVDNDRVIVNRVVCSLYKRNNIMRFGIFRRNIQRLLYNNWDSIKTYFYG